MSGESWPELGEELARKSLELLHQRMHQHVAGELPENALWLVADTLADVTQGLIPSKDWNVIYTVRTELDKARRAKRPTKMEKKARDRAVPFPKTADDYEMWRNS